MVNILNSNFIKKMLQLIDRSIVNKILTALLFLEIGIISYIAMFTYPSIEESNRIYAESSLKQLLNEKRLNAEYLFAQVEHEVMNLGLWVSEVLDKNVTEEEMMNFYNDYYITEDNILTNYYESCDDVSNIFFSYDDDGLTTDQIKDIINTSKLDEQFRISKNRLPFSEWIYFITDYNLIRTYPASKENIKSFPYNHNFKDDIYYSIAKIENNPDKKPTWTNPYWDYLGKGLVITCAYPIYNNENDKMIGTVCIDVGLQGLQKSISDLSIEGKGVSFLVDKEGKIIYYPNYQLSKTEKGYVVNDDISIFAKSNEEKNAYKNMLLKKTGVSIIGSGREEEILLFDTIPELEWIIGIKVNRHDYNSDYTVMYHELMNIITISIILILIILIYFYNVLSKPLNNLIENIKVMGEKYINHDSAKIDSNNEIKILNNTFDNLKRKLDNYIEQINYKNDELQTIFDNMPQILYTISDNYDLLSYNKNVKKFIDDENINFFYRKCYVLLYNKNNICDNCPVKKSLTERKGVFSEVHINSRIYNISSFPIYNHDGSIRELIIFGIDKTDEIVKNMELINAEKFAMIGELSASITHQLKSNISVIKGASYLLNDIQSKGNFDINEIKEVLISLDESIKDAENTVTNLLKFNTSGDEFTNINIINLIEQILVIEKNNLYKNNIKTNKQYEQNEICINASENSLKYILANLIRNSIESMANKGGTLTIKVFRHGDYVHVEIADTGISIDKKIMPYIFEPFFTTKKKGSGLGLWIAKKQVKKLNGHIYCESTPGLGTSFIIVLPIN